MAYEFVSPNDININDVAVPLGIKVFSTGLNNPIYDAQLQVQENLKTVLLTYPGERVGEWSTFGCRLRELVFEPNVNDSDLKSLIVDYIVDAVDAWIPNVNLIDVDVTTAEDDPSLKYAIQIRIIYNVTGLQNASLQLNVNESGTITA